MTLSATRCAAAARIAFAFVVLGILSLRQPTARAADDVPDLIVHNGRVVTVDPAFSVAQALSVKNGRVLAVGGDEQVLATRGPDTAVLDLAGRTVLPGLIDSHVHPGTAAMTEFDHPVPDMQTVADVLDYVRGRAAAYGAGKWVEVKQVFITRLKERRYPTRAELDAAAPENPVVFATGPDASLNTLALKLSGIGRDFKVTDGGPGHAERDPATGEPTGILRGCTRYVKSESPQRQPTEADRHRRTLELFAAYNAAGLTTVGDRAAEPDALARYAAMRAAGELTVRLAVSMRLDAVGPIDGIRTRLRAIADGPGRGADADPMLRVVGVKAFLDGGMLTGSAYMLEPWGVSRIYSIADPQYRGVMLIPPERLLPIVRATAEAGLQFTAHAVGDGGVRTLLDAYEQVGRELPPDALKATRPCVTHCNFVHPDDVPRFAKLGVSADIQPVWLYLDGGTLDAHFGRERLSRFQPLHDMLAAGAMIGGGSDHMQKLGPRRSINPYDPFLGIATAVTRRVRDGRTLYPEQALMREQAVRMYTRDNAWLLFKEHEVGSLERGKLADFVVLDTDVLNCPADEIAQTQVLRTYLGGRLVFDRTGERPEEPR
jgi:predicted amidohydrolase YtcJ